MKRPRIDFGSRRWWWRRLPLIIVGVPLAIVAAALIVGGSGLISISASSGHWGPTAWFLHYVMRASVRTQSLLVEEGPPLDDAALIRLGGGHYAAGCAVCHAAPGIDNAPLSRSMTPAAPHFPEHLDDWSDAQLYWIVYHGVKYSGMPHWPALERDDEPWALVAFLKALPDLSEADYQRIALGDVNAASTGVADVAGQDPLADRIDYCAACHGRDGLGRDGTAPRIAGLSRGYIAGSLRAYRDETRPSGFMTLAAANLDEPLIEALATHYAGLPVPGSGGEVPPRLAEPGERIAHQGVPERRIPACEGCHGPQERAQSELPVPDLGQQPPAYLAQQLLLFGEDRRGGPWAQLMDPVAHRLTDAEREAVAAWYAAQPARPVR